MLPQQKSFNVADYNELIVPRLKDIQSVTGHVSVISYDLSESGENPRQVLLCEQLLHEYPIFWHRDTFLNEQAYGQVAQHLDQNHFYVREIEI